MALDVTFNFVAGQSIMSQLPANAGGASVSITSLESGTLVAPYGIQLHASSHSGFDVTENTGTGFDPTETQLDTWWEVSGVDLGDFPSWNPIPDIFRNRSIDFGKRASFCLDQPGTYTITLCVIDRSGNVARDSITRTVQAASAVYTGADTGVVSFASNFTGKPTGATELSSVSAINTFLASSTSRRVLFRRGENFTISTAIESDCDDWIAGSSDEFGSGALPTLTTGGTNAIFGGGSSKNNTVHDLIVRPYNGGVDTTDGTGDLIATPLGMRSDTSGDHLYYLWHNIDMAAFENHTYSYVDGGHRAIFSQVKVQGWGSPTGGEYGLYWDAEDTVRSRCSMIGCAWLMDNDAWVGVAQGPVRIPNGYNFDFKGCYFFSLSSDNGTLTYNQPAVRFATNVTDNARGNFYQCVFEGGTDLVSFNQSPSIPSTECNVMFDSCIGVPAYATTDGIRVMNTGFRGSNCLFYSDDKTSFDAFEYRDFADAETSHLGEPVEIYNNTVALPSSSGWGGAVAVDDQTVRYTNKTEDNNLIYGSSGDGLTSSGTLDLTTALAGMTIQSASGGPRETAGGTSRTDLQTAALFPTCIPQSDSGAEDAATTGLITTADIAQNIRPTPATSGAHQI